MNEIELWSGTTKALIDPIGAWLTNLSDEYGDVLYPKRILTADNGDKKTRGGCHVCLPNFGPGGDSGQPQHGFGREMPWEITQQHPDTATLQLPSGKAEYKPLVSTMTYTLNDSSVKITLDLTNSGETTLRVAPGFHPYFVLDRDEGQVQLNDQTYDNQDLSDTEFFNDKDTMNLKLRKRNIVVSSQNLSTWAFWTDQLGDYVCVEPTVGGYTFLEQNATDSELLLPSGRATYSMDISW